MVCTYLVYSTDKNKYVTISRVLWSKNWCASCIFLFWNIDKFWRRRQFSFWTFWRSLTLQIRMMMIAFIKKAAKMAAKIEFCQGWDPRPCASVNHRQTGWGPHQCGWSDDARATLQRRPRHELAWIWTDFLANRSVNGPAAGRPARRRGRRVGGNDSLHDVCARLKISSQ